MPRCPGKPFSCISRQRAEALRAPSSQRLLSQGSQLSNELGRVLRFNGVGADGLIDGVPPGGAPLLDEAQRRALAAIVESGPIPASHGVVRWRLVDLAQWVWDEFRISISKQTLSREMRAMGYRKLSARPRHHTQDADAIPTFKKTSLPQWRQSERRSRAAQA